MPVATSVFGQTADDGLYIPLLVGEAEHKLSGCYG
jgi:hypothetical protein